MISKIILSVCCFVVVGCSSLLPTERTELSKENVSFHSTKVSYDNVVLNKTLFSFMKDSGFDPYKKTNTTILVYTDMISRFMSSDNIKLIDLPDGIQLCIQEREKCLPYVVKFGEMNRNHIGNVTLDLFGFVEEVETTGWYFEALFVIVDGVVVYKIFEGDPNKYEYKRSDKPLGPLQNIGNAVIRSSL